MWVDNQEKKPERDAAPDCQMCELFNNTHTHSLIIIIIIIIKEHL